MRFMLKVLIKILCYKMIYIFPTTRIWKIVHLWTVTYM